VAAFFIVIVRSALNFGRSRQLKDAASDRARYSIAAIVSRARP